MCGQRARDFFDDSRAAATRIAGLCFARATPALVKRGHHVAREPGELSIALRR
jgi:hypothetical protein